ncbi:MAG: ArgE/DapE family deacylase [Deltaproteobacteria bacterium]|nr:ArgE/DapE family deacylase [Deltaproteobacteria bacterium]
MIDSKVKSDVVAAVDGLADELVQLLVDTVKIPSVNPNYAGQVYDEVVGGEGKVSKFLQPVMEDIGLKTDLWAVEAGRENLVGVYKGTGGGKSLIFNGHVDVVPPDPLDEWIDESGGPWSGKISGGKIWGRGACDMKAGNAAAIIALKALLAAGYKPKGDVILEDVVGEEMMNTEAGTGATIERGYKADGAIVVEPSGPPYRLGIIPASPGVFYMIVTIKGKAVHVSVRDELIRPGGLGAAVGVNSIDKAMIVYEALNRLEEEWGQTKSHPLYTRPGHFTIHPGMITGGPSGPFVVSDESTIHYAIWCAPQEKEEDIKAEVEEQIRRFAQTDPWLRENPPKVEWPLYWPPYDVPVDAPICQAVHTAYQAALDEEPKYYGFAAVDDAAFLNLAGIPAITIGPGSITVAHAPNEHVEIEELMDACRIYALAIVEWCGV